MYIINICIFAILIISSFGMYSIYPNIKEQAKKYETNVFDDREFLNNLSNSNYGIYFDMIKNKEKKLYEPSDILLNLDKKYDSYITENMDYHKNEFNQNIYSYKESLDANLKNLEYYAVKKDSNSIEERNQGDISLLLTDNADIDTIEALNKKYSFYMVIDYDDTGKYTIKKLYGANMSAAIQGFDNSSIRDIAGLEMNPIKSMTYIYAVPSKLLYTDSIVSYEHSSEMRSYRTASRPFITMALLIMMIIFLIIPYKVSKESSVFRIIAKIPVELACFMILLTLTFILVTSNTIIGSTITGDLINLQKLGLSGSAGAILIDIINIFYWFLCFLIVLIGITIIKHIFKTGIIQYIKQNSLIYKIILIILKGNKRLLGYLKDINLKEANTKKLLILLGINFLILSVMSSIWFLGILGALIYTVFLFIKIRKYYTDISNKYTTLLAAANKIAEGNLDMTIEEDLGIFNVFKKEIENIQKGLKKAVNEEVKSEKMKTELITNVSHDLKTPLTSIITYVDLLKGENLSEEKRRDYLDTLDRKSQRLQELIEDLFEISKAASGNINLNIAQVDVVALAKQTLLELDDKISKASLIVKTNYPEEKVILPLDSQRMFRVLENLIINITKYAMPSSRVYIDIVNTADMAQITFKNMSASELTFNVSDLMERFVRGDKSRNTEGSGLGLAIAKSFVELQGGEFNVNVDGDLFKVTITFPKTLL